MKREHTETPHRESSLLGRPSSGARLLLRGPRPSFVLASEGKVDLQQSLLVLLRQVVVRQHGALDVVVICGLEYPGLDVERLGGDPQRLGDLLEYLGRRLPEAPLDLAQVGVRDPRQLRQPPEREPGGAALLADEGAELAANGPAEEAASARAGPQESRPSTVALPVL